jgi:hypothetical protein
MVGRIGRRTGYSGTTSWRKRSGKSAETRRLGRSPRVGGRRSSGQWLGAERAKKLGRRSEERSCTRQVSGSAGPAECFGQLERGQSCLEGLPKKPGTLERRLEQVDRRAPLGPLDQERRFGAIGRQER